ncbi:hypothetical protein GGR42_002982 [Saonia flava]|uniref:Uncharacterized protein n=1 Tax=Saonia flava TaxID=523696 RepID=A0A846QVZ6_9FLAO|nr:hypothetical protein [Saonia flava]NJB72491.1 hypothetical protein [Saonia flava]
MKKSCLAFLLCYTFLLFSYKNYNACDFAGTNIASVQQQTLKAIEAEELGISKFFAYKAINGIEKSKEQLEACGCDSSKELLYLGLGDLIMATKTDSINTSKSFLTKAFENISQSLREIEKYNSRNSKNPDNLLAINSENIETKLSSVTITNVVLQKKIDSILVTYEESLDKAVQTVNCKEARAMALKIYQECEKELLMPNLTEAKRYYNYRTKEITKNALDQLVRCEN